MDACVDANGGLSTDEGWAPAASSGATAATRIVRQARNVIRTLREESHPIVSPIRHRHNRRAVNGRSAATSRGAAPGVGLPAASRENLVDHRHDVLELLVGRVEVWRHA